MQGQREQHLGQIEEGTMQAACGGARELQYHLPAEIPTTMWLNQPLFDLLDFFHCLNW